MNPKISTSTALHARTVSIWLMVVTLMILAMIMVGGVTRLTGSGLSIVEWKPVAGILPPLSEADWQELFVKYQATPQYQLENLHMSLDDFKGIFFWEYWHRVLGRLIGFVFLIPLVWFAVRRQLSRPLVHRLTAVFVLGGLQGAMGWYMVMSGLVDVPRVSHLRLAAHLGLAMVLMAWIFWIVLEMSSRHWWIAMPHPGERRLFTAARVLVGLLAAQIVYGAFTAGLRAGYGFNTFPDMNGFFLPPGVLDSGSALQIMAFNPVMVQFVHRILGWTLLLGTLGFWYWSRSMSLSWAQRRTSSLFAALVLAQFGLGVATLLSVIEIRLAVLHQTTAGVVLLAAVAMAYAFRPTAVREEASGRRALAGADANTGAFSPTI